MRARPSRTPQASGSSSEEERPSRRQAEHQRACRSALADEIERDDLDSEIDRQRAAPDEADADIRGWANPGCVGAHVPERRPGGSHLAKDVGAELGAAIQAGAIAEDEPACARVDGHRRERTGDAGNLLVEAAE